MLNLSAFFPSRPFFGLMAKMTRANHAPDGARGETRSFGASSAAHGV